VDAAQGDGGQSGPVHPLVRRDLGPHGVDRPGELHGVPLHDHGGGDDVLRGDREEPTDAKGEEDGGPSGCIGLITDAAAKAAAIIFWYIIFSVIRLEVIIKIVKNMWR
jgi:hypothetical protein